MTQQDDTTPIYPVKANRSERFQRVFQVFTDEAGTVADDLTGATFHCDVVDVSGFIKYRLNESSGITRPDLNAVMVTINTIQMAELTAGQYRAELYARYGLERENFVFIKLTLE